MKMYMQETIHLTFQNFIPIATIQSILKYMVIVNCLQARNTTMYNLKGTLTSTHFFDERVYKIIQLDTQVCYVRSWT